MLITLCVACFCHLERSCAREHALIVTEILRYCCDDFEHSTQVARKLWLAMSQRRRKLINLRSLRTSHTSWGGMFEGVASLRFVTNTSQPRRKDFGRMFEDVAESATLQNPSQVAKICGMVLGVANSCDDADVMFVVYSRHRFKPFHG